MLYFSRGISESIKYIKNSCSCFNHVFNLNIRLPKGYDKKKSYPLIIKSDGNFNLNRWDKSITELSHKQVIEDSIIVAIPKLFWGDTRNRDLVPPYAKQDVQIGVKPPSESSSEIFGKPELFSGYFAYSPAAWYHKSIVVNEFKKGLHNTKGKPLFLYLSLGGAENEIITGSFKGLLTAIDSNAPINLFTEHSYNADHVENPYISVPKALEAYYRFRTRRL